MTTTRTKARPVALPKAGMRTDGLTMIELLVTVGIGALVLAVVATLANLGARSFATMVNYSDLDQKSRQALDVMTREIRQATRVTGLQTALPTKWLRLTNADEGHTVTFTWTSTNGLVLFEKTGQPARNLLADCDEWDFALYTRQPCFTNDSIKFYPATNLSDGKLIDISWKCSRNLIGQKLHTESVQTAQIVLRNKAN